MVATALSSLSLATRSQRGRLSASCPGRRIASIGAPVSRARGVMWRRHALEIDFTDPSFLIAVAGALIGVGVGIGFPVFMVSRDKADEERLEALRELNRETYEATGEYLSKDELSKIRPPRWTDTREWRDDD